jgi:hypothetical protein
MGTGHERNKVRAVAIVHCCIGGGSAVAEAGAAVTDATTFLTYSLGRSDESIGDSRR